MVAPNTPGGPGKKPRKAPKVVASVTTAVIEHVAVTSPPQQLNLRDHLVAWGSSAGATLLLMVTTCWQLVSVLLASVADHVVSYLQQIPRHDRPAWLAGVAFLAMGVVILNKRRVAGPSYMPPGLPPAAAAVTPPVARPVPPGTPPDVTKSAF